MASLHVLKGPNAGQRLMLSKSVTIMGREAKDCDVVINNQAVSRVHAQISLINGQYFIEDLRSRNKTYLNTNIVEGRMPLRDNDRVKICDSMFTFHTGQDHLPPLPDDFRRPQPVEEEEDLPSTVQATVSRLPQKDLLDAQPNERLRALLEISTYLGATHEQDKLLERITAKLFETFRQADRCFIIMKDETHGNLVVRHFRSRRPSEEAPRFSKTIVSQCLQSMQAFLVEDATTDSKFSMAQSITDFRIRSVMIAPLGYNEDETFGVIQLDTQDRTKRFTQDDLKLLASVAQLASIALHNSRMQEEQLRRERVLRDISIAEQVQRSFLPQQLPRVAGYEFYAYYRSAQTIGGDYYDFIELPDGRWAMLCGDVAGKGVPAALLMAQLSGQTRFHMLTQPEPTAAFARINDFLIKAGLSDRFVTLAAAILDPHRHRVDMINAGHVPPLIHRAAKDELEAPVGPKQSGFALGMMPGSTYSMYDVTLNPGDTFFVFTDGITDAYNPANQQFKIDGVRKAVCSESAIGEISCSPARLGKRLVECVRRHIADREQYDDIALVTFGRYDGPVGSGTISKVGMSTDDQIPLK